MLKPILLAIILFMLVGGGGVLKLLAAKEVSGGQVDRFVRALVWTGWLKGETRRAVIPVNEQGKFWYETDALGSTYALTTAAGDVRARGGYDLFGEPIAEYGQQVGQPFVPSGGITLYGTWSWPLKGCGC